MEKIFFVFPNFLKKSATFINDTLKVKRTEEGEVSFMLLEIYTVVKKETNRKSSHLF